MALDRKVLMKLEQEVIKAYRNRCAIHPERWQTCIHHEPPRSLNPRYKEQPWTFYPLCSECHADAHEMNRDAFLARLNLSVQTHYPNVKDRLHALVA